MTSVAAALDQLDRAIRLVQAIELAAGGLQDSQIRAPLDELAMTTLDALEDVKVTLSGVPPEAAGAASE